MVEVAKVKSGEVWISGRSHSAYFDLDLGEVGDLTIRLDCDGKWDVDIRELAEGDAPGKPNTEGLRDFLIELATHRGTRGGIAKLASKELTNGHSHQT